MRALSLFFLAAHDDLLCYLQGLTLSPGPQTFEASSDYIKGQFMEQSTGNHQIYTHLTCAISTENVKFVFKCVKDTIINSILSQLSLY